MKAVLASILLALVPFGSVGAREQFACNLSALTSAERAKHQELSRTLLAAVQERKELPTGYAFRLPPGKLVTAAEWVAYERKCCPFFTFAIEQSRDEGPLWLRLTGPRGVKEFIRAEFQH